VFHCIRSYVIWNASVEVSLEKRNDILTCGENGAWGDKYWEQLIHMFINMFCIVTAFE